MTITADNVYWLYILFTRKDKLILYSKDGVKCSKVDGQYDFPISPNRWSGDWIYDKYGVFEEL